MVLHGCYIQKSLSMLLVYADVRHHAMMHCVRSFHFRKWKLKHVTDFSCNFKVKENGMNETRSTFYSTTGLDSHLS